MLDNLPVLIFTIFVSILILFQFALAAGAPWGEASMGGRYPGKYPQKLRVVAIVNGLILILMFMVILTRARLAFEGWFTFSQIAIWVPVAFFTLATILNIITPSKIERIWAPVALILAITSLLVALG